MTEITPQPTVDELFDRNTPFGAWDSRKVDPAILAEVRERMLWKSDFSPILRLVPNRWLDEKDLGNREIADWSGGPKASWLRVIVPVRGAHDRVRDLMDALASCGLANDTTIVCHDSEADELLDFCRCVISTPDAGSFARNCNVGADDALDVRDFGIGRVLVFLNSDTVPDPSAIWQIAEVVRNKYALACGPSGTNVSGIQGQPGPVMGCGVPGYGSGLIPISLPQRLVGFALAVDARAFEAVGGFAEDYGNNYEDDDLCIRLTALHSMTHGAPMALAWRPSAFVQHVGGASFAEMGPGTLEAALATAGAVFKSRYGWLNG